MTKESILAAIRSAAAANGGAPVGMRTFHQATGIQHSDWFGIHWRSWGDAVREAGFTANTLTPKIPEIDLLRRYAEFTRELGRAPTKGDLKLIRRRDKTFPSESGLIRRFGTYDLLRAKSLAFCEGSDAFADVVPALTVALKQTQTPVPDTSAPSRIGYVYMLRHGSRPEYKIGFTWDATRREGEIRLQLPEPATPVHYIATVDPSGVEAYWHGRFKSRRKNGEWFGLSAEDVKEFKRWKRIS